MRRGRATLAAMCLCAAGTPARAGEIPCSPVAEGEIVVDGLLNEWRGVDPYRVATAGAVSRGRGKWSGPADLSFSVRCNHDKRRLYLAVRVRDDRFVCYRVGKADDHVRLQLGRRTLVVYPGNLAKIKRRVSWGDRGRARGVKVAEAMERDGYTLEIALPLRQIKGYRPGAPSFPGSVTVADIDRWKGKAIETVIGSGRGRFAFSQQRADLGAFLKDRGFKRGEIRFRKTADVAGDRRVEIVLLVRRTLGIVGADLPQGGYFFLDLPIRRAGDVRELETVDLSGDGKAEILVRYLERAKSGSRELVAVYRFDSSGKFVRPLAQELRKRQGEREIVNRLSVVRRRGRRRGVELVVDRPEARGFTEESYREAKARDAYPILLPWGAKKRRIFRFEHDQFSVH